MSSAPASGVAAAPAGNVRERKAAKGRRRRAAAEQRRIEQQRWGKYLGEDDEDDFSLVQPSPPVSAGVARRRRRRNERHSLPAEEDLLLELDDPDLALSLALSLSISEGNDMSYESLVQLENVSCVASAATVAALPMCVFVTEELNADVCVICQSEYDHGDSQVRLPCLHNFHHACGSEWLLKYSRLCPVCKHEVVDPSSSPSSSL